MELYKLLEVNNKKYIYDSYDNILKEIPNELFSIIGQKLKNKTYYSWIKKLGLRDIYNDHILELKSPLEEYEYKWKMNNRQRQMILLLTENCNMRCKYCGYYGKYDGSYERQTMSRSVIEKAISKFLVHSNKNDEVYISFYGGEPLLYKEKIKYAVELCENTHLGQVCKFTITTNGLCLDDDIIDFLVEKDFILVISLDGPEDMHDRYRIDAEGKPTFNRIINNISRLKQRYPEYYENRIRFNVVNAPPYNADKLNFFFSQTSANLLQLKTTEQFSNQLLDINTKEEMTNENKPVLDNISNLLKELKKFHKISEDKLHVITNSCGYCDPFSKRLFVKPDGKIHICEKVDENNNDYIIGDIENWIDYKKLSELFNKTHEITKENCLQCWALRFCPTCYVNQNKIDFNGEYCKKMRIEVESKYREYIRLLEEDINLISYLDKISVEV